MSFFAAFSVMEMWMTMGKISILCRVWTAVQPDVQEGVGVLEGAGQGVGIFGLGKWWSPRAAQKGQGGLQLVAEER